MAPRDGRSRYVARRWTTSTRSTSPCSRSGAASGAVMLAHGINHIFGGGKIAGTARWFESLGMKPGIVHAWLASLTEVVGGALLVLGLLTPFGGAAVIGVMLVAIDHQPPGQRLLHLPPGRGLGVRDDPHARRLRDRRPRRRRVVPRPRPRPLRPAPGTDGLLIALVAGVGGAAALLLAAWRPAKPPATD